MSDPLRPGDPVELGGYQLLGRLGQGGMGAVYLGRDASGRLVAVKVIRPEYAAEPEFRGRFRSEVNRARQVPPFCTAEVLDADPDHSTPYLVVEYVDGPSLAQVIAERGPLTAGSLHSVAIGVATALAAIHGAGVIHRDLKPANVLFALGTPKVIDFGIARAFEATSQHTRTDQMVGTVSYMAPERFDDGRGGTTVGPAADVFAWGAVVAYAGSGRTPFHADSAAATAARILTQPPDVSGLPEPLRHVVARTLAKDPVERPTAAQLLDLLLDLDADEQTLRLQPDVLLAATAVQRNKPRRHRVRAMLAVVAGLAVLAAGTAGVLIAGAGDGSDRGSATSALGNAPAPGASRPWTVPGNSIVDRLDRPGQWSASESADGSCAFKDGLLEAETDDAESYRCQGPQDSFAGDQSILVDTVVFDTGACAEIWFRRTDDGAYQVSVCAREARIGVDTGSGVTDEVSILIPQKELGDRRRIEVTVRDKQATVAVDGATLLTTDLREPSLTAGRVEFGVLKNEARGGRVAFSYAEVRTL